VAIILIIAGLAMIAYPIYLRIQARLEQSRLEQAFIEQWQKYHIEAIGGKDNQQEPSFPKWDEFPPTQLEIPAVDLSVQVVAVTDMGVFSRKLNQPPSYYPESVFPGEVGNLLIAGHRGGPAGYFHKLFDLNPGDEIILRTPKEDYFYEVEEVFSVEPTQVEVIAPLDYAAITLTTCQRVGSVSSAKRLIVRGKFVQAIPLPYE
jgi:LPXTG-site transpeptidase (sortase) family protein